MKTSVISTALILALVCFQAFAQGKGTGKGPVASNCEKDIQQFCPGIEHGQGRVRNCLENNREKLMIECKNALDSTGPGKGQRSKTK